MALCHFDDIMMMSLGRDWVTVFQCCGALIGLAAYVRVYEPLPQGGSNEDYEKPFLSAFGRS